MAALTAWLQTPIGDEKADRELEKNIGAVDRTRGDLLIDS